MKHRNSIFTVVLLAFSCFALLPLARAAVVGPPQNGNTADGFNALRSLTTGVLKTAIGPNALFSDTTGSINTATGGSALLSNTIGNFNTATGRSALFSNTTGSGNTATVFFPL